MIGLRGHHLFCLLGFRGIGYSPDYAANMKRVHQTLREQPSTQILIIDGVDDLCAKFPCDAPYHCDAVRVREQDQAFLRMLQLAVGDVVTWQDIEERMRAFAAPAMIEDICFDCQWRAYGMCVEGVTRVVRGEGLPQI